MGVLREEVYFTAPTDPVVLHRPLPITVVVRLLDGEDQGPVNVELAAVCGAVDLGPTCETSVRYAVHKIAAVFGITDDAEAKVQLLLDGAKLRSGFPLSAAGIVDGVELCARLSSQGHLRSGSSATLVHPRAPRQLSFV